MAELRPFRPDDLDALYEICLATADSGNNAAPLHTDPKLIGHLYAAPYGVLEPDRVIIAEDELGAAGYIVGTLDTDDFSARLEREWWPPLRQYYAGLAPSALSAADRQRISAIMQPSPNPPDIVAQYPAHIHMNLLPRLRGQRVGTALLERWIAKARRAGVRGIHLGANARNAGGIAFWTRSGFKPLQTTGQAVWFGMDLTETVPET